MTPDRIRPSETPWDDRQPGEVEDDPMEQEPDKYSCLYCPYCDKPLGNERALCCEELMPTANPIPGASDTSPDPPGPSLSRPGGPGRSGGVMPNRQNRSGPQESHRNPNADLAKSCFVPVLAGAITAVLLWWLGYI